MRALSELPNIGKDTERLLNETGIHSVEALCEAGAEKAWLNIQAIDPSACYNRLLGLEGAVQGMKKSLLPGERKAELKAFYNLHKCTKNNQSS
ncbi:TfoX/Sxy family protein [Christensenellaceae bacterium OttesenSCG-928-L17]|nr:TfoX/Sxy family protein [Christensenellaceae bacterium OttesenSCG-928-L17]